MTKMQAIVLLHVALAHCEGISEVRDLGINVCDLQTKIEGIYEGMSNTEYETLAKEAGTIVIDDANEFLSH